MSDLKTIQRKALVNEGLLHFTRARRYFFDCEANISLMASAIEKENLLLNALSSWEKVFEAQKDNLATRIVERPAPPRTPEEEWPYKFPDFRVNGKPDFKAMNRLLPGKMYSDFYFDRKGGELSQTALDFRRLAQEAIDAENQKRSRS